MTIEDIKQQYNTKNFYEITDESGDPDIFMKNINDFMQLSSNKILYKIEELDPYEALEYTVNQILRSTDEFDGVWLKTYIDRLELKINPTDSLCVIIFIDIDNGIGYKYVNLINTPKQLQHIEDAMRATVAEELEEIKLQMNKLQSNIDSIILERLDDYTSADKESKKKSIVDEIRCKLKVKLGLDGRSDTRCTAEYVKLKLDGSI